MAYSAIRNNIKYQLKAFINRDHLNLSLAIKCLAIGFIALLADYLLHLPQGIFLFLSAILFMLLGPIESVKKSFISMLVAAMLSALGCFIATTLSSSTLLLASTLFALGFICIYLSQYQWLCQSTGIIAIIIIILGAGLGGDVMIAITRALDILLGLVIAVIFTFIIFPYQTLKNLRFRLAIALNKLADYFYHTITDSLRGNYLNLRHLQRKNELIKFYLANHKLKDAILVKNGTYLSLSNLADKLDSLLSVNIAIANILNNPIHSATIASFFPDMRDFYSETYRLYKGLSRCIKEGELNAIDLNRFELIIDEIINYLKERLVKAMQAPVIYYWPIEISNIIYLLNTLKVNSQSLTKAIEQL